MNVIFLCKEKWIMAVNRQWTVFWAFVLKFSDTFLSVVAFNLHWIYITFTYVVAKQYICQLCLIVCTLRLQLHSLDKLMSSVRPHVPQGVIFPQEQGLYRISHNTLHFQFPWCYALQLINRCHQVIFLYKTL